MDEHGCRKNKRETGRKTNESGGEVRRRRERDRERSAVGRMRQARRGRTSPRENKEGINGRWMEWKGGRRSRGGRAAWGIGVARWRDLKRDRI